MRRAVILAVAAVLVIGAGTGAWLYVQWREERAAEVAAANAEVRSAIADRYEALADATTAGGDATAQLHLTLQEHLTVSERTDEELTTDRELQQGAMGEQGRRLQELAEEDLPEIPEMAERRELEPELEQLAEDQERARELGERFIEVAAQADGWADALLTLREQADRYVETVEGQPDTVDPDELQAQWQEELEVLEDYRAAADRAAEIPGLTAIAEAYLAYIDANAEFAEEAIELLSEEEIEEYNERLRDTYGDEDPFGFQAAVVDATAESLDVGLLGDLAELRDDASELARSFEQRRSEAQPGEEPGDEPAAD